MGKVREERQKRKRREGRKKGSRGKAESVRVGVARLPPGAKVDECPIQKVI